MGMELADFRHVILVDFEFTAPPGGRPTPICMVAREFRTGRTQRLWEDDLRQLSEPPYPFDDSSLVAAYYGSAEFGCYDALGWPMPSRVLDLFTEFRNLANGLETRCGYGLLGALAWFGLDAIDAAEKDSMRDLAIRGGPFTTDERTALLGYCEQDVDALERLLPVMLPCVDLDRALLRGRYMVAAARMESVGVPIDARAYTRLRTHWDHILDRLIERIDADYGVFEGRTFRTQRFASFLAANDLPWPQLPSGNLALDDDTFREMARSYPQVAPLRELRVSLSQLRLADLAVGRDGRNRCLLSAFRARTGRNQPSNSRFIFGPAVWLRGLIRPEPGHGLAYIDWSQQEFVKRPRFSWTRIKGESNVQGGGGNGSIEGRGTGRGIGADGGSPKGDWSPCRRGGGRGGLLGAGAAVERQPEARRGAAAAAWRIAGGAVP